MGLTATSREIGGIFIPNFKKVRIKDYKMLGIYKRK